MGAFTVGSQLVTDCLGNSGTLRAMPERVRSTANNVITITIIITHSAPWPKTAADVGSISNAMCRLSMDGDGMTARPCVVGGRHANREKRPAWRHFCSAPRVGVLRMLHRINNSYGVLSLQAITRYWLLHEQAQPHQPSLDPADLGYYTNDDYLRDGELSLCREHGC